MRPDRRFELPEGLTADEERAVINSLEKYFVQEDPRPWEWTLAGRLDATGQGVVQTRKMMDRPWQWPGRFARPGIMRNDGRGDAR